MKSSFVVRSYKAHFLLGAASVMVISGLLQAGGAQAQDASSSAGIETVSVTATRVSREGYSAPTPTIVLGADQIANQAPANLADLVNEVPTLSMSTTPLTANAQGFATAGENLLNLRDLGPNRTLVLLDGSRTVPANTTLNTDINLLPTELVKRVDIVTGGASADWGSDAVAGVVNFVLDKKYTGLKGFVQSGATEYGDGEEVQAGATYGTDLLSHDRVGINSKYSHQGAVAGPVYSGRGWYQGDKVLANPNGTATDILLPNVGISSGTDGGLITTTALRGTQFIGTAGTPVPFNFGFVSGAESVGGSAEDDGGRIQLQTPQNEGNVFSRASYDLSDNLTAYGEVTFAKSSLYSQGVPYNRLGNITINTGNPFLPASIQTQMTALGITSFTLGKVNQQFGFIENHNSAEMLNLKLGLEGHFGEGWSWDAYYQHGHNGTTARAEHDGNAVNYNAAVDAVTNPATGQIVCRTTLTNPNNGCVPFGVFGTGATSAAVTNYLTGTAQQGISINQDDAAANLRGTPISTWAGPVSVATGVEYRRDHYAVTTDAISQSNGWFLNYGTPASGGYNVVEGYAETVVPLLSGLSLAKELDFNGAIREAGYSASGNATTWKLGLTYDVIDDLRFRATRSTDIRAPNLQDLFATGITTGGALIDRKLGTSYQINQTASGNANLTPEVATTTSVGTVFQPRFLPNLSFSADYFKININNAITTPAAQTIIDQCTAGNSSACALITRSPSTNLITNISVSPLNIQSELTSGIDYAASYRVDLADWTQSLAGSITLRALATDTWNHRITLLGATTQYAGTNGDGAYADPKWRGLLSLEYDNNLFSTTATVRYIGSGVITNKTPVVVNNAVPDIAYFDLAASYQILNGFKLYGVIDNLLDTDPPPSPQVTLAPHLNLGVDDYIYDTIGRRFRIGVRFEL